MVAAFPHQAGRRSPSADQARQARSSEAPQAANTEAAEEVIPMTATVAAMYATARRAPVGRAALALVWLGVLIATCGLAQLHIYLRRYPLTESRAITAERGPASATSAGAGRHFHPLITGGAAQVAGPAVHSTTPAVDGERVVFRGSAP